MWPSVSVNLTCVSGIFGIFSYSITSLNNVDFSEHVAGSFRFQ